MTTKDSERQCALVTGASGKYQPSWLTRAIGGVLARSRDA
jgi:hypothetical protein